jgi:hypothetical protein
MDFRNKLECLSMESFSNLVQCFLVKQELTLLKSFSSAQLKGRLLALHTKNRLDWKGLPGTNAVAYYDFRTLQTKKFYIIGPSSLYYKTFYARN